MLGDACHVTTEADGDAISVAEGRNSCNQLGNGRVRHVLQVCG
jgi:hypothetical protein